jgi:hypothetical protein
MFPLYKKKGERWDGNGRKYYIDCSTYMKTRNPIEIASIIKRDKQNDIAIIDVIAKDETIKNNHIVIKIGKSNKTTMQEYEIGKLVNKIPGFIKYTCLFRCYDNTGEKIDTHEPLTKICDASNSAKNEKDVLVMQYIQHGSIGGTNWKNDNIDILKNLLIQTMFSLALAFDKVGFVHQDLHWGNVLFTETKTREITYNFTCDSITIPTNGYKPVIMDFEKAVDGQTNLVLFWSDLLTFFQKSAGLRNENNELVLWNNEIVIRQIKKIMKTPVINVVKLAGVIQQQSDFDFINVHPMPKYDPNVI